MFSIWPARGSLISSGGGVSSTTLAVGAGGAGAGAGGLIGAVVGSVLGSTPEGGLFSADFHTRNAPAPRTTMIATTIRAGLTVGRASGGGGDFCVRSQRS